MIPDARDPEPGDDDLESEPPDDPEDGSAPPAEERPRMRGILILPSLITLGSTFCGFLAISYTADAASAAALGGDGLLRAYEILGRAGLLLGLAMIFDALDGRVARFSHMTTEFGGQLDSLSDAISFGVAPAFLAKVLTEIRFPDLNPKLTLLVCALFVICTVLRLARYNVEHESQVTASDHFRGLPSPGAAGVVASLALLAADVSREGGDPGLVIQAVPVLTFICAVLMISRFRYVHVMNRFLRGRKPFTYLVVIIFFLVFIELVTFARAAPLLLVIFALSGPFVHLLGLLTGRRRAEKSSLFD